VNYSSGESAITAVSLEDDVGHISSTLCLSSHSVGLGVSVGVRNSASGCDTDRKGEGSKDVGEVHLVGG